MIRWYAVMTAPRMEEDANANLRRQGFWTFYPFVRVREKRKISGRDQYRIEWTNKPYFPRYMFVAIRKAGESLYDVNETDGVSTVVYCGDQPLPIPEDVMDELMQRADLEGNVGEIDTLARKKFQQGEKIVFKADSPYAGLMGLVSLDRGKAVKVWLELLGAKHEVTVPPDLLEGKSTASSGQARRG